MAKRFKRNRKPLVEDEVSEYPYKVFEEKLRKAGVTNGIYRVKRPKKK